MTLSWGSAVANACTYTTPDGQSFSSRNRHPLPCTPENCDAYRGFVAATRQPQSGTESQANDEPMTDERLTEIEADHAICCPIIHMEDGVASQRQVHRAVWDHCDIEALISEVRRLRRVLHLSESSRGMPGGVDR